MNSINATNARKNFYQLIKDVNLSSSPITITNTNGDNAVLISEADWNAIQETMYINSVPHLAESILESDKEPLDTRSIYDPDEEW
ncbi:MAG TPA: type II toxin-antitoxin system prevent-host-death family antitoxin [Lachnospiraceae bacterium]|nr:type II toxin-antitoxin system Phd/YefM family antitoxin [Acutalibacteraceae bacterium]HCE77890.1 type II toxin-antitoxin system prevent-host-death family antitoxin [Lachnospiraceae bacterium]